MFIDARTLDNNSIVEADIAIIGGGPAGITLAREFAGRKAKVCLIESGGLEADADTQALYEGESTGIEYPVAGSRLRYFGGSANHWGGYCRPLDEIDFEQRDWIPHSGWPFSRSELDTYYNKAAELIEIAPAKFEDSEYWRKQTGEDLLTLATGRMDIEFVHYSSPPMSFAQRYNDDLKRGTNIRVLLNANVTRIVPMKNAESISHLLVKTLNSRKHTIKARTYILATGALENARILLLSRDYMPNGVGNNYDLVGRFFMEHPHISGLCELVVADIARLPRIYHSAVLADKRSTQVAFTPSSTFLRNEKLLNATFQLNIEGRYQVKNNSSLGDAQRAASHLEMLRASRRFLTNGINIVEAKNQNLEGVWLGVGSSCEQAPNPDSRVTLSDIKDALGQQKIKLDWRLTEQDRLSYFTHVKSLVSEFGALGLGRMKMNIEENSTWPQRVDGSSHHMGTTRMSNDPSTGVVDADCKVHGIDNLYIAGSSVFPTSGTANPTLTIIALALRLADHLKRKIA